MFYYNKYPEYFDALNRGNLTKPCDSLVQFTLFTFILVAQMVERSRDMCGKFLSDQFSKIAEKFEFRVSRLQCHSLANTWLKNYSVMTTPRSSKEVKLKELKLS